MTLALTSTKAVAANLSKVNAIYVKNNGKKRLTFSINLSSAIKYKTFILNNPERLVIDLLNTKLKPTIKMTGNSVGLIRRMRHAVRNNTDIRIVLDIASNVTYSTKLRGNRLDISLSFSKKGSTPSKKATKKQRTVKRATKRRAKKTASVKNYTPPRPSSNRKYVIAIDPGHGGKDPGAVGRNGTKEKDVVLQIGHRLQKKINKNPAMKAIMVRNRDHYVSLRKRIAIARKHNADLFISIHADANPNKNLRGSSVYVLSDNGASSEAARFLAQKENKYDNHLAGADLEGKSNTLASMLLDLSQTDTFDKSLNIANNVLKELGRINPLLHNRVESAAFVVLKSLDIPSLLVETAFISNTHEEKKLRTPYHQQRIANAIYRGLNRYRYTHESDPNNESILLSNTSNSLQG